MERKAFTAVTYAREAHFAKEVDTHFIVHADIQHDDAIMRELMQVYNSELSNVYQYSKVFIYRTPIFNFKKNRIEEAYLYGGTK